MIRRALIRFGFIKPRGTLTFTIVARDDASAVFNKIGRQS